MGLFSRKPDPISARGRLLNDRIAELEAEIKKLGEPPAESLAARPTRVAHEAAHAASKPTFPIERPAVRDPVFEKVARPDFDESRVPGKTPEGLYNDLGLRKYDLIAVLSRAKHLLRGRSPANPKLVSYLAAGSLQGLRPLRYEKRVARNRFLLLTFIFLVVVIGLVMLISSRN